MGQQRSERISALDGETATPVAPEREPRRGPLALLIAPIVVMIACGYVADALWPTLVEEHPLWLLGLSARNRYAVLVVNRVDLWAYYLWGTLRLLLPDPFFFALGWFYGPAALRWMEQRTPTVGTMMRRVESWFGRWGHPLVVLIPNNYVCLIAGAARMSPVLFAFLNVTGTVGRLALLQVVGDVFSGPDRLVPRPGGAVPHPAAGGQHRGRGGDGRRRAAPGPQGHRGPPGARALGRPRRPPGAEPPLRPRERRPHARRGSRRARGGP